MHYTPKLPAILAACAALQFTALCHASPTVVRSPDSADTYADNAMQWHQLRWKSGSQALVATITFSNSNHVSDSEPAHNETFDFRLPGVRFDAQTGAFYVRTGRHGTIQIATLRKTLFGNRIELLSNAQIQVNYRSGHVQVSLVASQIALASESWVENWPSGSAEFSRVAGSPLGGS
jgi:hypothetical protein